MKKKLQKKNIQNELNSIDLNIRKSLYTVNKINFMAKKFKCYYTQEE